MEKLKPVLVTRLFPQLLDKLLEALLSLSPEEWELPSTNPSWTVRDVALHLLGGDIGQLSMERDGFESSLIRAENWDQLVISLNAHNEQWVSAGRRISPQLLCDLLRITGEQVHQLFASLNPCSIGPEVSWAGPGPTPMWLHIARNTPSGGTSSNKSVRLREGRFSPIPRCSPRY